MPSVRRTNIFSGLWLWRLQDLTTPFRDDQDGCGRVTSKHTVDAPLSDVPRRLKLQRLPIPLRLLTGLLGLRPTTHRRDGPRRGRNVAGGTKAKLGLLDLLGQTRRTHGTFIMRLSFGACVPTFVRAHACCVVLRCAPF